MTKKLTHHINRVLSKHEEACKDDVTCITLVYREQGTLLTPDQIDLLHDLRKILSIVRIRARIQQQGRFRPRDDTRSGCDLKERPPHDDAFQGRSKCRK